jgi:TetR/AcrR family transcriptional repressor of nem operon
MPRPLSFDPTEKLHQAMMVFWRNGYEGTSINTLISELEINRFSLYSQFGDKHQLYLKVLEHYNRVVYQPLLTPLRSSPSGKAAIDRYLENFSQKVSGPHAAHGCLIQSTLLAGENVDPEFKQVLIKRVNELKMLLRQNLKAAQEQGELAMPVKDCLDFTLMTINALLMARKSQGKEALIQNVKFFRETLKNW